MAEFVGVGRKSFQLSNGATKSLGVITGLVVIRNKYVYSDPYVYLVDSFKNNATKIQGLSSQSFEFVFSSLNDYNSIVSIKHTSSSTGQYEVNVLSLT